MSIYMYRPNMNKLCCLNILFYKFHGRYYQRSFVPRPIHMKNIFPWNIFPHFVFFYNLPTYFINETAGRCTVQSVLLLGRESIRENFCIFHTYFTLEEYCKKNASPFEKYKVNSTCEGVTSFHKASIKVGTFTNKSLPTLYKNYHQYPFTHKMQVAIILWVFYVELYIHFWISKTWSQKIKTYLLFLFSF